jgi:hypothetical protein
VRVGELNYSIEDQKLQKDLDSLLQSQIEMQMHQRVNKGGMGQSKKREEGQLEQGSKL